MDRAKHNMAWSVVFCVAGVICTGQVFAQDASPTDEDAVQIEPAIDATDSDVQMDIGSDSLQLPQGQNVDIGSFGEIDLHVKDLDLTKVLQLLSIQSQRNIIASRNVAGSVSADLYDVDFYEALDAILHTNGFGYREKGNFIYVYTQDELAAIEEAERQVETRIVRLDYLTAADASTFVQPMLSPAGSIAVSGDPNPGIQATMSTVGASAFASQGTLVIRDYAENLEQILATLEQLDERPKQVLIESTILTAGISEQNQFGVDFSIFTDVDIDDFATPLGAVDELISGHTSEHDSGQVATSNVGKTGTPGSSFKVGVFNDDFAVFMRALDSVTDTTVLANPKLLVLNRQKASLLVGERLGYLSTTSTETSQTQTVEFLDVGTQLSVVPTVSSDNFVRLALRPSISEGTTSVEAGSVIPNTSTNEMISEVLVQSGQTVVLGGFFRESNSMGRSQIPGMGDIPIFGAAFKGQDDSSTRDEVIFLIKPTIIHDEVLLAEMGEYANESAHLAMIGSRERLLPWSNNKLVTSYLRDAERYIDAGNFDKAEWAVDKALYIRPTSVEAQRLKERLTDERIYYMQGGILDHAVDAVLGEGLVNVEEAGADASEPIDDADQADAESADAGAADQWIAETINATESAEATSDTEADAVYAETDTWIETTDDSADEPTIVPAAQPIDDGADEASQGGWFEAEQAETDTAAETSNEAETTDEGSLDEADADADTDATTQSGGAETADELSFDEADAEADAALEAAESGQDQAESGDDSVVNIFDYVESERVRTPQGSASE